jgi:hypothetical protein
MTKALRVLVFGLGLAIAPGFAMGQAAPAAADDAAKAAPVIPVEDQPTKEQLAKLFEVMRLKEQMAAMLKQLPVMMQQQVTTQMKSMEENLPGGNQMTAEQKDAIQKLTAKYMEKALNLYPADEMISDMSSIYQKHLSREDVDSMIAFYVSPAGKHLLELSPVVMKEYMPMVMSRMQARTKALSDEMAKDFKQQLLAGGDSTAPTK